VAEHGRPAKAHSVAPCLWYFVWVFVFIIFNEKRWWILAGVFLTFLSFVFILLFHLSCHSNPECLAAENLLLTECIFQSCRGNMPVNERVSGKATANSEIWFVMMTARQKKPKESPLAHQPLDILANEK
jgi:hypothetical protein